MILVPPQNMKLMADKKTIQPFRPAKTEPCDGITVALVALTQTPHRLPVRTITEIRIQVESLIAWTEYFTEGAAFELSEFAQQRHVIGLGDVRQRSRAIGFYIHTVETEHDMMLVRQTVETVSVLGYPIRAVSVQRRLRNPLRRGLWPCTVPQ